MSERELETGSRKGELHENGGLSELQFESLQVGDTILLETESGSSYRLSVSENENRALVTVERNSSHDVVGDDETIWESVERDVVFDLRGSCKRILVGGSIGLRAVDDTEGHFIVGQRAWLGARIDGKDRTLITTNLVAINLIPSI